MKIWYIMGVLLLAGCHTTVNFGQKPQVKLDTVVNEIEFVQNGETVWIQRRDVSVDRHKALWVSSLGKAYPTEGGGASIKATKINDAFELEMDEGFLGMPEVNRFIHHPVKHYPVSKIKYRKKPAVQELDK